MSVESDVLTTWEPDYSAAFGNRLSHEQAMQCEMDYGTTRAWLPDELKPEIIGPADREAFGSAVNGIIHNITLSRVPTSLVTHELHEYYRRFPPDNRDRVVETMKIAYQNEHLKVVHQNPLRCPEAMRIRQLALAYRARDLRDPTASMYGLLTAYGMSLRFLHDAGKVTTEQTVQRPY